MSLSPPLMKTSLRRLAGLSVFALLAFGSNAAIAADAPSPGYHLLKEIPVPTDGS